MSTDMNKALIERLVDEVWRRGNVGVIDELFVPDWVNHGAAPSLLAGPEGLKAMAAGFLAAFAEIEATIDDLIAEGDRVAWPWTFRGTHISTFQGIARTDRRVTLKGITVDRIRDGRFVERWEIVDSLGLLQQLGGSAYAGGQQHPILKERQPRAPKASA